MITYCCLNSYISARVSNSSEIIGAYEAHFPCDMLSLSLEGVPRELSKRQSVSSATGRACACVHHILYTYRGTRIIAWRLRCAKCNSDSVREPFSF